MGAEADEETALAAAPVMNYKAACEAGSKAKLELFSSILVSEPGCPRAAYLWHSNLTPFTEHLFFLHSYYDYILVFYLFSLAYYKGYALEYSEHVRIEEFAMILLLPALNHLRFFFGHWGFECGTPVDLAAFLLASVMVSLILTYFTCLQAYLVPLDHLVLQPGLILVVFEGLCGIINAMQALRHKSCSMLHCMLLYGGIMAFIAVQVFCLYVFLLPPDARLDQDMLTRWLNKMRTG